MSTASYGPAAKCPDPPEGCGAVARKTGPGQPQILTHETGCPVLAAEPGEPVAGSEFYLPDDPADSPVAGPAAPKQFEIYKAPPGPYGYTTVVTTPSFMLAEKIARFLSDDGGTYYVESLDTDGRRTRRTGFRSGQRLPGVGPAAEPSPPPQPSDGHLAVVSSAAGKCDICGWYVYEHQGVDRERSSYLPDGDV